jgi:hypothetical protein
MIRSTLLVCTIALLTSIGAPSLGDAPEPEPEPSDGRSQQEEPKQPEGRQEWRERLLIANQEVAIAQKYSETALRVYENMRHRRRPRGDAKQAIMDELELSREALTTAQQDLEKLEKAARRAGAPPSWLKFDPTEIGAATQAPASQQP